MELGFQPSRSDPKLLHIFPSKKTTQGNSLAVQWLGLPAFTAEGAGSIPGQGTKVPASLAGQPKKKKKSKKERLHKKIMSLSYRIGL